MYNVKENQLFASHYKLKSQLGRGGFSEVWLAEDVKAGIDVAIKIYAPGIGVGSTGSAVFRNEFSLVFNLNHSNLLRPTYFDVEDNMPYLVMPYIRSGSVNKLVGKMSENDIWKFIHDVASGLAYLHSMEVIHQDIKPDNIMVGDDGHFLITDFGVSTKARSTLRKSVNSKNEGAGTQAYMAPERFGKEPLPVKANDIWSLGATTFELMTGDAPFGDFGGLNQKGGADVPTIYGEYSEKLKALVEKCLDIQPWNRPKAESLRDIAYDEIHGITHLDDNGMAKTIAEGGNPSDNDSNHDTGNLGISDDEKKKNKKRTFVYILVAALVALCCVLAYVWLHHEPGHNPNQNDQVLADTIKSDSIMLDTMPEPIIEPTPIIEPEPIKQDTIGPKPKPVDYNARFSHLVSSIEKLIAKADNPYDVNSLLQAKKLCDSLPFYSEKLGYNDYMAMNRNVEVKVNEKIDSNYNKLINEAQGYVKNATTDSFADYEAAITVYELAIQLKRDKTVEYEIQRLRNIVE